MLAAPLGEVKLVPHGSNCFSVFLDMIIMIVLALLWTKASREQTCRQCSSMSMQPGVRASIGTWDEVRDKFRKTRHPRLRMDLFV